MSVRKTTISQEEVSVPSLDTDTSIDVVTVSDNIPLLQNQQTNNESVAVHNAHNYQGISSAAASSGMANVPVNSDLAYDIVISSTSTEKHPLLQHLNVKVHDVLNAFDAVPGKYQLDALDILQSMINHVMQKITSGRISAVKFVPIENTSKDIIVVKQEPIELNSPSTSPPPAEHNDSDLMATIGAIEYQQPGAEQSPAPVMMVKHEPFFDEGPLAQSSPIIGKRASSKNDEIVNTNHGIAKIKSSSNAKAKGAKKTKSTAKSTKSPKKLPVLKIKLTPPKQKQGKSTEKTSESASGKSMRRALHMDGRTSTRNSEHIESDRNVIKTARHPKTSTTCTNAQELQDNFIDDLLNIDVIKETQELVEECLDNDETKFDNHIMVSRLNGPLTLKPVKDFKTTEEIMSMFPEEVWTKRPGNRKYDKKCKYKCDQCPYSTNKKDHMNVHKVAHTKEKRFHCAECDKYFTAANSLKRHLMIHSNERNHPCPICDKRFYTISELRAHAVTHTGEKPHQCSLCEKSYTLSANLRRHMRVHTGEMPYKCDICDNVAFRDYTSLKNHKLKHSGEKPHTCEVCGKRFRTSSDIIRHRRIHSNIKEYTCDKCGKAFKQSATLTAHQKVHTDIYPFKCDLCPKSFRSKGSLQHHIRWHAGVKPYKCDHCNKSFSTKIYLGYHQVLHTSQKPFQCRICKKPFNQISNLRRHEQFVHSKLKKYKCRYCPKTFKYTNSLTYHEGTHTGVQLVCEKCGVSFRAPSTMRKHTKICTGEEIIPKRRGSSGKKISKVTKGASHKNINGRVHKTNNIKTKVIKQPRLFMEKLSPEGFGISNNISAAVSDAGTEIMNIHDIKDEPLDIKLTGKRVGESTVDLELMMSPLPNHETSDHI